MKNRTSRSFWLSAFMSMMLLLIAGFVSPAISHASTIYDLTSDHCGGTGGCLGSATSAGTITVADGAANTVTITITLASGFKLINGGFPASFGFNLAGNPLITYSSVNSNLTPVGGTTNVAAGSIHMDGTGFFEYGLDCTGCGNGGSNPQAGPFSITITGTGLSAASFERNAADQYFAVDIIGNGNTGGVDASFVAGTPEPSTLMLYGLGIAMIIGGQKLRKARMVRLSM
jgi:hypothetical protein